VAIGLSVPGAVGNWSAAGQALGFGRSPADQVPNESESERKKRLAAMQAAQTNIGLRLSSGFSSALGYSPAGSTLFGNGM
jgi:hypothetical protein